MPEKWGCFSSGADGHGARTGGACGQRGRAGHWGDALDLTAHARRCTRRQVLEDDGYLVPRAREPTSRSRAAPPYLHPTFKKEKS